MAVQEPPLQPPSFHGVGLRATRDLNSYLFCRTAQHMPADRQVPRPLVAERKGLGFRAEGLGLRV